MPRRDKGTTASPNTRSKLVPRLDLSAMLSRCRVLISDEDCCIGVSPRPLAGPHGARSSRVYFSRGNRSDYCMRKHLPTPGDLKTVDVALGWLETRGLSPK